jgi:hypothetical protein
MELFPHSHTTDQWFDNTWACHLLLTFISNLKMEEIRFSETSVNFCRTTLRHIPEDSIALRCHLKQNCACFSAEGNVALF